MSVWAQCLEWVWLSPLYCWRWAHWSCWPGWSCWNGELLLTWLHSPSRHRLHSLQDAGKSPWWVVGLGDSLETLPSLIHDIPEQSSLPPGHLIATITQNLSRKRMNIFLPNVCALFGEMILIVKPLFEKVLSIRIKEVPLNIIMDSLELSSLSRHGGKERNY